MGFINKSRKQCKGIHMFLGVAWVTKCFLWLPCVTKADINSFNLLTVLTVKAWARRDSKDDAAFRCPCGQMWNIENTCGYRMSLLVILLPFHWVYFGTVSLVSLTRGVCYLEPTAQSQSLLSPLTLVLFPDPVISSSSPVTHPHTHLS